MGTILLKGAQLVTMNAEEEVFIGDLLIEDNKIKEIAAHIDMQADQVIDARGKVLLPGFIQTHIHLCQTLFRGRADDLELMDWLRQRIWPLEAAHDEESVYYSAMLGLGELISSGTTTILDMETVHHTDSAFQAMAQSGIRVISGKVMMDHGDEVPEPSVRIQQLRCNRVWICWRNGTGLAEVAFSMLSVHASLYRVPKNCW